MSPQSSHSFAVPFITGEAMKHRPLLQLLLISFLVVTAYGCGGGGGTTGSDSQPLTEGIAPEAVPPEDLGFADRSLIPPVFIVVSPRVGAGSGSAWVFWPESLAMNVLDENNL